MATHVFQIGAGLSKIVDGDNPSTIYGTSNPFPVKGVASDGTIGVTGQAVTASNTYTSSSELSYEPDVGMFLKSDQSGTLKFQFSPDNSTWSTFPVNGFTVAAGIWEFHTAVKLPRYFRFQFVNDSASTATIDAYVYYGTFRQGNAPLNQSIGADSDATIVRSVQVGIQPNGIYSNLLKDGSAFRTTDNLAGTTLDAAIVSDSYTGNITVGNTTDFGASGYIYIDSEFIAYTVVDGTTLNITTRGAFGSTAAAHSTTGVSVGEVYDSGILTLEGYTEVATKIVSSNDGSIRVLWFSDSTGTDIIRSLNPPYSQANGYDYLSAPNFGPYTRYLFANTASTTTTDLYYETEFYTKSVSAQVLTVNSTILEPMTANLTRSIISGQNKASNFKNCPVDSEGHIMVHLHDPTSAFGQIKTSQETTVIQIYFPYKIDLLKLHTFNLVTAETTTGGTGSGLTVDYTTNGSGVITKIFPRVRGSGYVIDDTITVNNGTSGQGTVSSIDDSGGVLTITLASGGTGYTDPASTAIKEKNMAKLTTEAAANRKIVMETINKCKYQTGTGVVCRFTGLYNTGTTGLNQYIGIGDENNGYFLGYQGTTFGILRRQEGSEIWLPASSFNVDLLDGSNTASNPSSINSNFQTGNVFMIQYQWLGFGAITFSIEDPSQGDFEPFHIIKYANANTMPSVFLPTLPIRWEIENTTNTSASSLYSASAMAAVEGKINYQGNRFAYSRSATLTNGYAFSIRVKEIFEQQKNVIQLILRNISIGNDANNGVNYTVTLNGTLGGSPSWSDIDTNSCVEVDTASGTAPTGGTIIEQFSLAKDSNLNFRIENGDIILEAGDILTITCDNNTTQNASINWIEYE